jgi:hypothetical protein
VSGPAVDDQTGSFDDGWLGQYQRPRESQAGLQPVIVMSFLPPTNRYAAARKVRTA